MLAEIASFQCGTIAVTGAEAFCGSGPDADRLSNKIQDAWLAFARTGNPSCDSLGSWPAYGDRRETMMLGKNVKLKPLPMRTASCMGFGIKFGSWIPLIKPRYLYLLF